MSRCKSVTEDGDQCKRKAFLGSRYCWQHTPRKWAKGLTLGAVVTIILAVIGLVADIGGIYSLLSSRKVHTPPIHTLTPTTAPPLTPTPRPTSTLIPTPTATPMAFSTATEGQSLIIVVDFDDRSGGKYQGMDPAQYIYEKLEAQVRTDGLDVRVERLHEVVNDNTARSTGQDYSATLVLWGWYDALSVTPRMERVKTLPEYRSTEEGQHLSLSDPAKIEFCIVADLPSRATYLTLFTLGVHEYGSGNYDQALAYLTSALAAIPEGGECSTDPSETYFVRGNVHLYRSDYDLALVDYDKAIELDPEYATAYNNRGIAYRHLGEYEKALADYGKAIELDPEYAYAYNNRGNTYGDLGEHEKALADYSKAIELDPEFARAYNNRGNTYEDLGEYEQAIADYSKAIELDPGGAAAYNNRGNAYRHLGEYEKAIADYGKAIELDPTVTVRTTYYVDATNGSDANDGQAEDRAWKTLKKVYNGFRDGVFYGGDRILFRRGERWTATSSARLRVRNVSGTSAANPLYIGAYGEGERPLIDGQNRMGSVILGGYDEAVDYVTVEDLAITGTTAQIVFLRDVQGWTLRNLDLGKGNKGLAINIKRSSQIVIDKCHITGASGTREIIYIGKWNDLSDRPHDIYITNCDIHDAGLECIDLKPGTHHVHIIGNRLANAVNAVVDLRGNHHVVKNNIISNPEGKWGIAVWRGGSVSDNHLIEGNLIKDIGGPGIRLGGSSHTVRNNTIVNCADECLKVSGSDVTVKNNIFSNSPLGMRVSQDLPDSDHNCFHSLTSDLRLEWYGGRQTISRASSAYGIENHSISSDPDFLDKSTYQITVDSPCYQAGEGGSTIGYFNPKANADMRPQYLKPRYYFVQPPFLVKVIQAWSFYGFQDLYEARRARFLRSRDG